MSTVDAPTPPKRKARARKPTAPVSKRATSQRARAKQKDRAKKLALQALFLETYAGCGVISTACAAAGINRRRHWEWSKDPAYREKFDEAHARACDVIRQEIFRRGVEGWEEPVFGKLPGKDTGSGEVGRIRKFSDRMLEILAKAKMPTEFRERLSIGGDTQAPPVQTEQMTPARAAELYRSKLKGA